MVNTKRSSLLHTHWITHFSRDVELRDGFFCLLVAMKPGDFHKRVSTGNRRSPSLPHSLSLSPSLPLSVTSLRLAPSSAEPGADEECISHLQAQHSSPLPQKQPAGYLSSPGALVWQLLGAVSQCKINQNKIAIQEKEGSTKKSSFTHQDFRAAGLSVTVKDYTWDVGASLRLGVPVCRRGPGDRSGQKLHRPAAVLHRERIHVSRGTPNRNLRWVSEKIIFKHMIEKHFFFKSPFF